MNEASKVPRGTALTNDEVIDRVLMRPLRYAPRLEVSWMLGWDWKCPVGMKPYFCVVYEYLIKN